MGKITVKHYLNMNLKPYVINGEKYFSIYALVTANRQNTKLKSRAFSEYYSISDFSEISDPKNKSESIALKNEEQTIINIAQISIDELKTFDTNLFSAVYNYFQIIFIFEIDIEVSPDSKVNLYDAKRNKMNLGIADFFTEPFSLNENNAKGMSIYTWYSETCQNELKLFLVEKECKYEIERTIQVLNKIVFYKSFDKLCWILRGTRKHSQLLERYNNIFSNHEQFTEPLYKELSI